MINYYSELPTKIFIHIDYMIIVALYNSYNINYVTISPVPSSISAISIAKMVPNH